MLDRAGCFRLFLKVQNLSYNQRNTISDLCHTSRNSRVKWVTNKVVMNHFRIMSPCMGIQYSVNFVNIRAGLFKTICNNIVTYHFMKFSEDNFSNMPIFFVENVRSAKASLIVSTKISEYKYLL